MSLASSRMDRTKEGNIVFRLDPEPRNQHRPVAQPPTGSTVPTWLRAVRSPAYGMARFFRHA